MNTHIKEGVHVKSWLRIPVTWIIGVVTVVHEKNTFANLKQCVGKHSACMPSGPHYHFVYRLMNPEFHTREKER